MSRGKDADLKKKTTIVLFKRKDFRVNAAAGEKENATKERTREKHPQVVS